VALKIHALSNFGLNLLDNPSFTY